MSADPPDLLTVDETASILHVAKKTLRNWRSMAVSRGPKHVKIGRKVMYRREDIDSYLEKGGDR